MVNGSGSNWHHGTALWFPPMFHVEPSTLNSGQWTVVNGQWTVDSGAVDSGSGTGEQGAVDRGSAVASTILPHRGVAAFSGERAYTSRSL